MHFVLAGKRRLIRALPCEAQAEQKLILQYLP